MKYFGFVGSALVLLLFGLSWCFPQPVSEPIRSGGIDRPVIRISSVEQLPERVDIDSSLPTIVPPRVVSEFAERWLVANPEITGTIVENPGSKTTTVSAVAPKKQRLVKREPVKKVTVHRAAAPVNNASKPKIREQAAPPVPRLSLLDILKDRFGQNLFTLN
jgi:hypothetical protein